MLLVEGLKSELSQTRLELETTLTAQHKHLKELDTLRLDILYRREANAPALAFRNVFLQCNLLNLKKVSNTAPLHYVSVNRAEASQKAAEVDALNDRLTEERKKSRDLQWAMEKERCRTGNDEESKREELEVRVFTQIFLCRIRCFTFFPPYATMFIC